MGAVTHSFHSLWSTEDQNTEEWQGPRKTSSSQGSNPKKLRIIVYAEDDLKKYFKLHGKQYEEQGRASLLRKDVTLTDSREEKQSSSILL